ncbi:MAG TPA: glycoside hydrolase family 9 protein, partial [Saprospiraceae bacterium]|nr:glycoside hydrolase family 9 protein [Saprospiraceae bacterium]
MRHLITITLLVITLCLHAQLGTVSQHLKIDQFGYPPDVDKVCVINNPTAGFDFQAGDFYTPGNTMQLIRASDNVSVYSGNITSWHGGISYDQSGDQIWWFNFSTYTTPGTYYIYDPTNSKRSFNFDIRNDVYVNVMKQAVRMFFYQRCGMPKSATYAYEWNDASCHLGTQQDLDCRLVTNPQVSNSKNLKGGWHDAGDYNKYVNFAYEPIHDLCMAYIEKPDIWTDDYNIPESGNGV